MGVIGYERPADLTFHQDQQNEQSSLTFAHGNIFKIIKKFTIKSRIQLVEGNLYNGGGYSLYKWKNHTDEKTFHANSI
jgi:hypothetical protein